MTYFYDGTKEGFLTAFLAAFSDNEARLFCGFCSNAQLALGENPISVQTDKEKAKKAENRLLSFDRDCMYDLDTLLRSGMENKAQIAFEYFRFLAKNKRPVGKMLAEPAVYAAVECIKKVGHEIHKMHGFIRFMETESGALYAPFSPDNDIVDRLVPHFRARLPQYPFVLHDVKRKKAAVYDGKNVFIAPLGSANVLISANEEDWKKLWQKYYVAVNIPSRERKKQMRGYMPVRYWKFLPETQLPPEE
ncbi:MAG: TIGR03915 family putative DNA repair protein [Clostridia bacterium]|nr:TIGR03915 family putative DNA repair protein [Clostridia bacterium]